jgi:2-haloacid dehalogenase
MDKLSIVFDVGGVLLDWNPRYLYRRLFRGDEQSMEQFLEEVDFFGWNWHQDAGRPFDIAVAEACQKHPQYCELIRAYDKRYLETIKGQIDGTVEILYQLKLADYPLYGLSNWAAEKYRLVRPRYAFFDCFEAIVVSGEVQMAKPDPRIFDLLLEQTGREARECLLIDDSEINIAAASEMGFQTIAFRSPEQLKSALQAIGILSE